MKCFSFLKIWHWRFLAKLRREAKKGAVTLISIFLYFIFTAVGLSLIFLSHLYLKISAFKKNLVILEYTAENGIKQGFEELSSLISSQSAPPFLSSEHLAELRENCRSRGTAIVEEALGVALPQATTETWNDQTWSSSTNFVLEGITEKENYFLAGYRATISSEGSLGNFSQKRRSALEVSVKILAGHIPLPYFPLLINKKLDAEQIKNFKEKNHIVFLSSSENHVQPPLSVVENALIPEEAGSLLSKALNIKIFYPQNLTRIELRAALGLERTSEPVPDGVYLIKNDLGLGGIYVQGDVEEMVLAIDSDFQVISFRTTQGVWILKFSPLKSQTFFSTPSETFSSSLVPPGVIAVNGKINSLGGGVINSSGQAVLVQDREIASILSGVALTIVSSDRITLSSHLIHQGLKWQEGIPYLKDSTSQLAIFSTGKDFWEDVPKEGKVVIGENSPQEIKIQASLTARSEGLSIEGERKTVYLIGSLQTADVESGNNMLKIASDTRLMEGSLFPENSPEAACPVLFVLSPKSLEWKEFR